MKNAKTDKLFSQIPTFTQSMSEVKHLKVNFISREVLISPPPLKGGLFWMPKRPLECMREGSCESFNWSQIDCVCVKLPSPLTPSIPPIAWPHHARWTPVRSHPPLNVITQYFSRFYDMKRVQGGWGGWPTGNGKKVSNSQACCLVQLCLAAA